MFSRCKRHSSRPQTMKGISQIKRDSNKSNKTENKNKIINQCVHPNNKCTNRFLPDLIWTMPNENDVRKKNDNDNSSSSDSDSGSNNNKKAACTTNHIKTELHTRKQSATESSKRLKTLNGIVRSIRQWGAIIFMFAASNRCALCYHHSYMAYIRCSMWTPLSYAYKQIKPSICIT